MKVKLLSSKHTFYCHFLLLLATLSSCQAASFTPDVRWSCTDIAVLISVQTTTPFEGLIKARSSSLESCYTKGIGTNLSVLKIFFNQTECGMVYNQDDDTYKMTVDIHSHPILIIDSDQALNISCRAPNNSTSTATSLNSSFYHLEVYDHDNYGLQEVRYASPYSVRISSFDRSKDFTVGKCVSYADDKEIVQLTDFRGCSVFPALFGDFVRGPSGFTSSFPSMFRFPSSNLMTISCDVHTCDGSCEDYDCNTTSNEIPKLLEETTTMEIDSDVDDVSTTIKILDKKAFRRPIIDSIIQDDVPITSTEIIKTQNVSIVSTSTLPSTLEPRSQHYDECIRPADVDILYALCIFLTVCSTLGFTINIIFGCLLWRNRNTKRFDNTPKISKTIPPSAAPTDFWILDSNKIPDMGSKYDVARSVDSFASVKQKQRRSNLPIMEYGMPPPSRNSDGSSRESGGELSTDIYRRPDNRHNQSTFSTPSTTLETDLDSSVSSNQASSYH
ncbi:unnamed protein product [Auanema sp. JU1783]|nr:unnamed protein product [Auanema sp. JU1783]